MTMGTQRAKKGATLYSSKGGREKCVLESRVREGRGLNFYYFFFCVWGKIERNIELYFELYITISSAVMTFIQKNVAGGDARDDVDQSE